LLALGEGNRAAAVRTGQVDFGQQVRVALEKGRVGAKVFGDLVIGRLHGCAF
jgi:hypothetical protein